MVDVNLSQCDWSNGWTRGFLGVVKRRLVAPLLRRSDGLTSQDILDLENIQDARLYPRTRPNPIEHQYNLNRK